jgi:hypothetical protein
MLIEIVETHPPQNGKKLAKIKTKSGEEFGIWPDKLGALRVGQRYEVEVEESEFKGRTYRKITNAKPANGHSQASPASTSGGDAERRFIGDMLAAGVRSGAIPFNAADLHTAIAMLRALWRDVAAR